MELSEAIKKAIDLFGSDILLDSKKLANILSDYQAFSSPSHKRILLSMLEEGYGAKFISFDSQNDSAKRLFVIDTVKSIESNMGFQHDATVYIVDCICRALNWPKSENNAYQKHQDNFYKPNTEHNTAQQSTNRQLVKERNYTKPAQGSSSAASASSAANKQNTTNSTSKILAIGSIILIIIVSIFFINKGVNGGHVKFEQEFGNMQSGLINQEIDKLFLNRDSVNADSLFIADLSFGMKPESIIKNLQIYGISYGIDPGEYPTVASFKNIIPNSGKVLMRTGFDEDNQLRYLSFKLLGSFESVRKYCEKQLGKKYVEIIDPMRDKYCYWFRGNQCVVLNNTSWHGSYLEISDINYNPDSLYLYSADEYENLFMSYDIYKNNNIKFKCESAYFDVPHKYDSIASQLHNSFYIAYQDTELSSIDKYTGVRNDSVFVRYGWDFDYSDWKWYRSYTKKYTTKHGNTMLLDKPYGKTLIGHGSKDYEISVGSFNNNKTFTIAEESNGWALVPLSLALGHVQGWIRTSEIVEVPIEKRKIIGTYRSKFWQSK